MTKGILFYNNSLIYSDTDGRASLPAVEIPESPESFSFHIGDTRYICAETGTLPPGLLLTGLRDSWNILPRQDYIAAAKGFELLHWNRNSRFCAVCGARMKRHSPISKICPECNNEIFPQLSPAVLVLVKKNDSALLVHARNFSKPFFGLVAGFVETGESLEECVVREVLEETSLHIKNVRYVGSQTWPFPANLMIGFTAEYESGDIRFADEELSAGDFFAKDSLPMIPSYPSLAREMIDRWKAGEL